MKLEYLKTSEQGARWFRAYYQQNPQLNLQKASASIKVAEETLKAFPYTGHAYDGRDNVFEYSIQGTQFALLYTVVRDTIWVIDVRDQRGYRSGTALRRFKNELKARLGID